MILQTARITKFVPTHPPRSQNLVKTEHAEMSNIEMTDTLVSM
jgi:hypothetical protein